MRLHVEGVCGFEKSHWVLYGKNYLIDSTERAVGLGNQVKTMSLRRIRIAVIAIW